MIPDLYRLVTLQEQAVANFDARHDPLDMPDGFYADAYKVTRINCTLWQLEDKVRAVGSFADKGRAKEDIDKVNQQRHDAINRLDEHLYRLVYNSLGVTKGGRLYSETLGSIVDRLSILVLRLHHIKESMEKRPDTRTINDLCLKRQIATTQLEYLRLAGQQQANAIFAGEGQHIAWKSLKLYNDPALLSRVAVADAPAATGAVPQ